MSLLKCQDLIGYFAQPIRGGQIMCMEYFEVRENNYWNSKFNFLSFEYECGSLFETYCCEFSLPWYQLLVTSVAAVPVVQYQ